MKRREEISGQFDQPVSRVNVPRFARESQTNFSTPSDILALLT